MTVTMEQVRAALLPEEPDYVEAAGLGEDALPHVMALIETDDEVLAPRAAYLAGLLPGPRAAEAVRRAADSRRAVVRVAAAAAARHVDDESAAFGLLSALLRDPDVGVRKTALRAVRPSAVARHRAELERMARLDPSVRLREIAAALLSP